MRPARVNREPDDAEMREIMKRQDEAAREAEDAVRMLRAVNALALHAESSEGAEIAEAKLLVVDVTLLLSRKALTAFETYSGVYHDVMTAGGER